LKLGIFDVRAWLDSMEPGALDEWIAYYQAEPWDRQATWPVAVESKPKMKSIADAARELNGS
jgi:hypothetical protein